MNQHHTNSIDEASKVIGKTWPLCTLVASNPFSGYENSTFQDAVNSVKNNFNANAYPAAKLFQQAWEKGDTDAEVLTDLLNNNNLSESPEFYLQLLKSKNKSEVLNENHAVDVIMAKWLSSFMDEEFAEWEMPDKTQGFYNAGRLLVVYDSETGKTALKDIPKNKHFSFRRNFKRC